MRKYLYIQLAIILIISSVLNIISIDEIISKEKEILMELQLKIKERLNFIRNLEENNSIKEKFIASENYCNISKPENVACVKLLEIKSTNIKIKINSLLNIAQSTLEEGIINFYVINFNKHKKSTKNISLLCHSDFDIKSQFLILFLTNSKILITNSEGSIIISHTLNIASHILSSDLSQLEEESSIILYLKDKTVCLIEVEMNFILGESYSDLKADLAVKSHKFSNLLVDSDHGLPLLKGHRIHGNKYIIASFSDGEVYVLNNELELISNISLNRISSRTLIYNGIIGSITKNDIIFLNLLGGNTVLLVCHSHYDIVDSAYEAINNLLYIIDNKMNLLIYEIKLSISKQNTNECYVIYKLKLNLSMQYPSDYDNSSPKNTELNNTKMILARNYLYIFNGSSYMAVIDLSSVMYRGASKVLNEFMLIRNGTIASYDYHSFKPVVFHSNCPILSSNHAASYALIDLNEGMFVFVELINASVEGIDSNGQLAISDMFFSLDISELFTKHMLVVYAIIIFIFFIVIIFCKIKDDKWKAVCTPFALKKYKDENHHAVEHILKKFNSSNVKLKNPNDKHNDLKNNVNKKNFNTVQHKRSSKFSN